MNAAVGDNSIRIKSMLKAFLHVNNVSFICFHRLHCTNAILSATIYSVMQEFSYSNNIHVNKFESVPTDIILI